MLKPEGVKILVKPEEVKEKTEGGIYIPDAVKDQEQISTTKGKVIEIGPAADCAFNFKGQQEHDTDDCARLMQGDVIVFAKYGGVVVRDGDEEYRIINDEDVVCKVV